MSGSILKAVSLGSQHTQEKFSLVKQPAGREPQFFYSTESHWEIWYNFFLKFEISFWILSLHRCTDPQKGTPLVAQQIPTTNPKNPPGKGNPCPNVSTTPIMAMGCRQCLSLSEVQLKGKH